jgi:hypothetical protein
VDRVEAAEPDGIEAARNFEGAGVDIKKVRPTKDMTSARHDYLSPDPGSAEDLHIGEGTCASVGPGAKEASECP